MTTRLACFPAMILAVLVIAAAPAAAQRQPRAQQGQATPNNDLWLTSAVGIEYKIDPKWSFHFDLQLQIDRDINRLRTFEARPGFEYALSPNWAVAAGYVQYQHYPTTLRTQRGSFQDLLHRNRFGKITFAGRLRSEELFFENSTLLVRARALAGIRIPIGDSPWEFALSDEIYVDLKVDGTRREAGFSQNKTFVGFGRPISEHLRMSAGYELNTYEQRGRFRNVHQLRLGVAIKLN
ncbi:MAG: DUF2490 domain-containing protein [Reyranella sp.]|nr:DUF2490 domain-containing protein [Reyranella sp.]